MRVSEEAAGYIGCPVSGGSCRASKCMAWRWKIDSLNRPVGIEEAIMLADGWVRVKDCIVRKRGYCGMAGVPTEG